MQRFRSIDRESDLATPILIQACLPEGHLARYIVEIVESLDTALEQFRGIEEELKEKEES